MANQHNQNRGRYKEVRNRTAYLKYFVHDKFEAGIILKGTEVKSIRAGNVQINDAFVCIEKNIPILYSMHIDEYNMGNTSNHIPKHPRMLLLKKREILRLSRSIALGGFTIIPIRLYFKAALIKIEIALSKGKKLYDHRDALKKKDVQRDVNRALRNYQQ